MKGLASLGDPQILTTVMAQTRTLLGESFDELRRVFLRRRAGRASQEKLHPLLALFEATRDSVDSLVKPRPVAAGFEIARLRYAVAVLEPWRDDPTWPDIVNAIKTPKEFDHTVIMLATAH